MSAVGLKRGEVWTAVGGPDYARKARPVLIVQDDRFDETASITVCLLTSYRLEGEMFRIPIDPAPDSGLRKPSYAMVDKITTVPRGRLGERIGVVPPAAIIAVNRAMLVFLGLAKPRPAS